MKTRLVNIGKTLMLPLLLCIVFAVLAGSRFLDSSIFGAIFQQTVYTCLLTFGMAVTMELGMWNFSLGATVYLSGIIGAYMANEMNMGALGILLVPIVVSVLCCAVVALLYRQIKMPLMIVALGSALVIESLCRLVCGGRGASIGFGDGIFSQPPLCYVLLAVGALMFYYLYNLTTFGQNLRAVGSSQEISYSAGLDIQKIKMQAIVLGGFFTGMAAVIYLCNNIKVVAPANEFASISLIFDAMLGFYIATFLRRYCEFTVGIVIGCVSMRILQSGLMTCGLSSNVRSIFIGIFVLGVLVFSSNQGRYAANRAKKQLAALLDRQYANEQKKGGIKHA